MLRHGRRTPDDSGDLELAARRALQPRVHVPEAERSYELGLLLMHADNARNPTGSIPIARAAHAEPACAPALHVQRVDLGDRHRLTLVDVEPISDGQVAAATWAATEAIVDSFPTPRPDPGA